jgi:hypothetical protein
MGNGYSHMNSGGVEIDCVMCEGQGSVKTLEAAVIDAVKKGKERKKKDLQDGQETQKSRQIHA